MPASPRSNAMTGKHYALAAASALFKFLEMSRDCVFAPKSLKIKYCPLEGTMLIDSESAKNLELVENVGDAPLLACSWREARRR